MKKVISLFFVLACSLTAFSQDDDSTYVKTTIQSLFEGMRQGDSVKVRSSFAINATLKSVAKNKTGQTVVLEDDVNEFIKAIGTPHPDEWNELIWSYDIKIDGPLATVWAPYTFYLGKKMSHCGVNIFQLIKDGNTWKIISIIDTRRKERCMAVEEQQ